MTNIAVFISGRGSNFHNLHQHIESGDISGAKIAVVVSNNTRAKGLDYAKQMGIDTIVIPPENMSSREEYDVEIVNRLRKYNIGLICLAGYMRIITEVLINEYQNKIINIHPSLLPSFAGLHAHAQAIDYGVKVTGCTLHFVDKGMDTGPIILQRTVAVHDNDTEDILADRVLKEEHKMYVEGVKLFCSNRLIIKGRKVFIKEIL